MTSQTPYDFHIHTKYLKCANGTMKIPEIVRECERLGVKALGITDHVCSLDDLDLHLPIKKDIKALRTKIDVYFGVELDFLAVNGRFPYSEEIRDKYGFQFAIGGIHTTYMDTYDIKKLVDIQHRHHLKVCQDPLVAVLVHPYWFHLGEFERNAWPWFDSMQAVPESYARELGQVARETGTAIEINACANLRNPTHSTRFVKEYIDYLAILAEEGVAFSIGSDAHDIYHLSKIKAAWQVVEQLKLTPERIWMPECKPLIAGSGKKKEIN